MFRALALVVLLWSCSAAHADAVSSVIVPTSVEVPAEPAPLPQWLEPPRHLTIQLPGMSHHFDEPTDRHGRPIPGAEFNERNWGVGIQIERAMSGDWELWVTKASFGLMKDSLNAIGVYAGYTWQKRLLDKPSYSVELGGGAFLFYRTLQFDGPHQWIPAVLPVLSVEHKESGLGINVVAVPRCHFSGGTMPGVIYLQFTKAF